MKPLFIVGVLLIAIGMAGLVIDNIKFTDQRTIIDAGPIKVTEQQQHIIPIPSVVGVIFVIAGAAMVFFGRQARG